MELIYVTDPYGRKVRVNKDDLDNPKRHALPIYNRFGVRITAMRSYDPSKHGGMTHIIRANIVGTPEYEESQRAYLALLKENLS